MLNIRDGRPFLERMNQTIQENRDYLSDIDGKIGDGDHGVNMSKGFAMAAERLSSEQYDLSQGLLTLSQVLMEDIGGSMGPLYGLMFESMAGVCAGKTQCDVHCFSQMLGEAVDSIQEVGGAGKGDKTLLDTLMPAQEAFDAAANAGQSFEQCLELMTQSAQEGWASTENMLARVGRASRLGERSRGVLDAGATSCYLLLGALAKAATENLQVNK